MLDSGSEISAIKFNLLRPGMKINALNARSFTTLAPAPIDSLGTTILTIFGRPIIFHVFKGNFDLDADGILGSNYFVLEDVEISYRTKSMIILSKSMCPIPFVRMIPYNSNKIQIRLISNSNNSTKIQNSKVIERFSCKLKLSNFVSPKEQLVTFDCKNIHDEKCSLVDFDLARKDIEISLPEIQHCNKESIKVSSDSRKTKLSQNKHFKRNKEQINLYHFNHKNYSFERLLDVLRNPFKILDEFNTFIRRSKTKASCDLRIANNSF